MSSPVTSCTLCTELDLKLKTVPELKQLLRQNYLSFPKLKAEMVASLLKNKIGTDGLVHPDLVKGGDPENTQNNVSTNLPTPTSFIVLPDEMIDLICRNLENLSLSKMSQVSKRFNGICGKILVERKTEFINDKKDTLYCWIINRTGLYIHNEETNEGPLIRINNPINSHTNCSVMGFYTQEEYETFQRDKIMNLDESELQFYLSLRDKLIPNAAIMDKEDMSVMTASGFCFDSKGRVVIYCER